jgi:hypothetical protein
MSEVEAALTSNFNSRLASGLQEVEAALTSTFNSRLSSGLQEAERRRIETDAELRRLDSDARAKMDAAVSEASTAAQTALRRALRPFAAEASSERRQRQAGHEELLQCFRRCEQTASTTMNEQTEALKRISDEFVASVDQRHREERGLWTKVHELSRTVKDRFPQERRQLLEVAEQNLDRGLERRVSEVREELRKEICTHVQGQSH